MAVIRLSYPRYRGESAIVKWLTTRRQLLNIRLFCVSFVYYIRGE